MNLDCLLLDGGRDGPVAAVPFLQALCATPGAADLPVILITDEPPEERDAWDALLAGTLVKPFDLDTLFAVTAATAAAVERAASPQASAN
jgi:DNA-binding response OmpR family regulator